jgi:peptide/nickel transport system permease protein
MNAPSQRLFAVLVVIHLIFLFCGFFAPYDEAEQDRTASYAPPTKLHFVDATGRFRIRPFVCAKKEVEDSSGRYEEDCSHIYPVRFFMSGTQTQSHLFGVDAPGRISVLGTDGLGRDQFSRLLFGARLSLFAGLLATSLALIVGLIVGMIAGFYGSIVDTVLMRLAELFLALPWIYLLLAVRAFLPLHLSPGQTFLLLVTLIGAIGWARPARLIRGVVLSAKQRNFVLVGRNLGATDLYLLRRHILPQVYGVVLAQAALLVPQYILAEITLSFLGLGVGEPAASLGNLLGVLQQYHVLTSYWWMFIPGVSLIPLFLAYFLMANALQRRIEFIPV